MIKNKCEHEWEKHTNIGADRRPSTYICKECNSEMTAGEVFQLEGLREQAERHAQIIESQNIYNDNQKRYNRDQLHWTKVLAVAAIISSLISVWAFYKSSTLAEYRPYVGIQKVETESNENRLNAKATIVNTSSIPANNLRVTLEQFINGDLITSGGTDDSYSAFLMPTPNHVVYRFWGDKKLVDEGKDWVIKFTFNYDGVGSKGHETQFSGRYDPVNNSFNIFEGYAN